MAIEVLVSIQDDYRSSYNDWNLFSAVLSHSYSVDRLCELAHASIQIYMNILVSSVDKRMTTYPNFTCQILWCCCLSRLFNQRQQILLNNEWIGCQSPFGGIAGKLRCSGIINQRRMKLTSVVNDCCIVTIRNMIQLLVQRG